MSAKRGPWIAAAARAVLVTVCLWPFASPPAGARAGAITTTTNVTIPLGLGVFVPCAAGGAGETVELSGVEHVIFHTTVDATDGLHVSSHFNAEDVSGVGLTTGALYRGNG